MRVPRDLLYTETHEWVQEDGDKAMMGITDYAQESMGEILYIELPQPGDSFGKGDGIAVIESVKITADVYAPFDGDVAIVNEEAADHPGEVNQHPYDTWLVEFENIGEVDLLSPEEYEQLLKNKK